ncbi:MAG: twin-arginine translocase TatA/TatE family subunit [Planctomycetaceae bacterium]|jgi:sec-independent protein translocase protein TatA|nr:twin-arginine translocase TatA/TatE family subunit [Planctomycetaceae bacterium]
MTSLNLLFAWGPLASPLAIAVLLFAALILFGNRLPSMMRSLGKSVVEFKKGVAGIEDDVNDAVKKSDNNSQNSDKNSEV